MNDKLTRLRLVATLVAGGLHACQAVLFFPLGLQTAAWASVVAVVWFVMCWWLIRRGMGTLAMVLSAAEVLAHPMLLTHTFGVESLYQLYYLPMGVAPFLVFERTQRGLQLGVLVAAGVLLGVATEFPPEAVSPLWFDVEWLARMNLLGVLVALVSCAGWFAYQSAEAERALSAERERSEALIRNMLPEPIAQRLKDDPSQVAEHCESATVVFADLVGFTELSARLSTTELLEMLNALFTRFDRLAAEHGVEKIKTIGDAYMAVCGVPTPCRDHPAAATAFALAMRDSVEAYVADGGHPLSVRVGIHTGPVVAGVIGTSRYAYDLWGDTVNVASRMESHGEPGRIAISNETRGLLGAKFTFIDRGRIEVKGKGAMHVWFVEPSGCS